MLPLPQNVDLSESAVINTSRNEIRPKTKNCPPRPRFGHFGRSTKFLPNDPAAVMRYASISLRADRQGRDEGLVGFPRDFSERLWHRPAAPPSVFPIH